MGKEYVVQGALAKCQFGATLGVLKVLDNSGVYMNGKRAATTQTLGNPFQPPCFGLCNINPSSPKPCTPTVTSWTDFYDGVCINNGSFPLTETSKATCAMGCPHCISMQTTGQIAIPGITQFNNAAWEHQADINPIGTNGESNIPILVRVLWKNATSEEVIDELPIDGVVTVCAETENTEEGECVCFIVTLEDGKEVSLTGIVGCNGWAEIPNVQMSNIINEKE